MKNFIDRMKKSKDPKIYGDYYVYPNGDIYDVEDVTLEELINSGYSDDCIRTPLPHDNTGYPYLPVSYYSNGY